MMLPPGAVIGIIGGGQLGRMLAIEARRLGYRTLVCDPDPHAPAAQVADAHLPGNLSDPAIMRDLAVRADVVTYEFENVSPSAVEAAEAVGRVYPSSAVLRVAQHRLREKEAVARLGFAVPPFRPVRSVRDLDDFGLPCVLKTAASGYDGRGQAVVQRAAELPEAITRLRSRCDLLIAEQLVDFALELSVICARDTHGNAVCFAPGENHHSGGILDLTVAPARISRDVAAHAGRIATGIANGLGVVGLLAVEMFLTHDGRILVNELAPRPHNSGHHTLDACAASQFEQLVRAICGLPLGAPDLYGPAAMANLLGDLWPPGGPPLFHRALEVPGVKLHLYGKTEARPGRKMGHLTAVADTPYHAAALALEARRRLIPERTDGLSGSRPGAHPAAGDA